MSKSDQSKESSRKLWNSFDDVERKVILFLVHSTAPTSLDALISLTGISAVQAINVRSSEKINYPKYG